MLPTLHSTLTHGTLHVQTLETHASLYQYIVNHQLQAGSITNHLGNISAATVSYETQVELSVPSVKLWTIPTIEPLKKNFVIRLYRQNPINLVAEDIAEGMVIIEKDADVDVDAAVAMVGTVMVAIITGFHKNSLIISTRPVMNILSKNTFPMVSSKLTTLLLTLLPNPHLLLYPTLLYPNDPLSSLVIPPLLIVAPHLLLLPPLLPVPSQWLW